MAQSARAPYLLIVRYRRNAEIRASSETSGFISENVFCKNNIYLTIERTGGSVGAIGSRAVLVDSISTEECGLCDPNRRNDFTIENMFCKNNMYRRKSYNDVSSAIIGWNL